MDFGVKEGLKNVKEYVVEHKDTADAVGNKGINVLSSPTMILWIEQTCFEAVKPLLPEGYETVGTVFNFLHLAATPVGQKVRVEVELSKVERAKFLHSMLKYLTKRAKSARVHTAELS